VLDGEPRSVCVIGMGPRGISVVERLYANLLAAPGDSLVLHLVDPYLGLGGRVWRTDQSALLLMNTVARRSPCSPMTPWTVRARYGLVPACTVGDVAGGRLVRCGARRGGGGGTKPRCRQLSHPGVLRTVSALGARSAGPGRPGPA